MYRPLARALACALSTVVVAGVAGPAGPAQASGPVTQQTSAAVQAAAAGVDGFVPVTPYRVVDTRYGVGAPAARVQAGGSLTVSLPNAPAGATGVALNVTALSAAAGGSLVVHPSGTSRPRTTSVSYRTGEIVPNAVVAELGADGKIVVGTSATVHVLVDVQGFFVPGAAQKYSPQDPVRAADSRIGTGTAARPLGHGESRTVPLAGIVPSTASAVVLNVTAVKPTTSGHVTVWPTDAPRPGVSNLNFAAGQVVPNQVVVKLAADRSISLYNAAGNTHFVVDVQGAFSPSAPDGYVPLTPKRVVDTRAGMNGRRVAAGGTIRPVLAPPGVDAVVLTVTAVDPFTAGYVTVYPGGTPRPATSNLNVVGGATRSASVISKVGADGSIALLAGGTSTDVVVDLVGYLDEEATAAAFPAPVQAAAPAADSAAPLCNGGATKAERRVLTVGTLQRTYYICKPPVAYTTAVPLVVVLHGYTMSPRSIDDATGWSRLGAQKGFATAYPLGYKNSWNAGGCCGSAKAEGIDDVTFIDKVNSDVRTQVPVTKGYFAGFSNGAMLGFRLACGDRGSFRAFALVSGTAALSACSPTKPRPVLAMNGLKDKTVPYHGCKRSDPNTSCSTFLHTDLPPVPTVMSALRKAGGCTGVRQSTYAPGVAKHDGTGCTKATPTNMTLASAGHGWVRDASTYGIDETATAWAYLSRR